jgi:hypothetical protein
MNAQNIFPFDLNDGEFSAAGKPKVKLPEFENVVGQDSLTRFDNKNKKPNNRSNKPKFVNKNKPNNQAPTGPGGRPQNRGPQRGGKPNNGPKK